MLGGIFAWTEAVMELGWWGLPIFALAGAAIGATLGLVFRRSQEEMAYWAALGAVFAISALVIIWLWFVLLLVVAVASGVGPRPRSAKSRLRQAAKTKEKKPRRSSGGTLDSGLSPGAGKRRKGGGKARGDGGKGGGEGDGGD